MKQTILGSFLENQIEHFAHSHLNRKGDSKNLKLSFLEPDNLRAFCSFE